MSRCRLVASLLFVLDVVAVSCFPADVDSRAEARDIQQPATYATRDVMPEFFRAYDSSPNMSAKLARFKARVIFPNADLYDRDDFKLDDPHLAWYLRRIAPRIDAMRILSVRLSSELPRIERRFDEAFPDMRGVSVTMMPALSHFDGQVHDVPEGGVGVFFGIDGIAESEGVHAKLGLIVTHELFHAYQAQVGAGLRLLARTRPTLAKTWMEGLAAYVSMRLKRGATSEDALLDATLARLEAAKTRDLACLLEERARSDVENDGDLFDASRHPTGLPPRGGYLVGFMIARELARKRSLVALAKLGGAELESSLDAAIAHACARSRSAIDSPRRQSTFAR